MQYYKKNITVDIHDVDFNGVARTSALMRYIQSAAQSQLTENGKSYETLKEQKRAFIISKIKMEFYEELRAFDPITATTFPCDSRGYSFLRCYSLEKFGKTIGRAISVWALIDTDTHALVRVNDFDLGLDTYSPFELDITRISLPSELLEVGTFKVLYPYIDQNRHMNNTAYPDMYSSFLPLENKRIESMSIHYINEAPLGDTITVFMGVFDNTYYFRTVREDGKINTEAEIILKNII